MNPRLVVQQKITAFVNRYAIYAATADGKTGALQAFAQQKRIALKEKISFYDSEARTNLIFTLRAEKVLDVHGRYIVEDANGNFIGAFKKEFKQSLLISTWSLLANDAPRLTVAESNVALALIRRFGGWIPIVGDIIEIVVLFFRYHFSFKMPGTENEVGTYQKTTLFRDHYLLSMTDEAYQAEDWRVYAAVAVALDAMQSR